MSAQPSWDDLAIFLATARGGGLSAAARALGIHHATVSRRLTRLEEELQVRLFDRRQQGLDLTAAGAELLEHVASIEAEVDAISRKLAGQDQRLEGSITVTTVDDLAYSLMPRLLVAFRARHPRIEVDLQVGIAHADLSRRQADVALRFGAPPRYARAVRRRISTVDSRLYASRAYLEAHPAPTTPEDLAHHDVIRGDVRMSRLLMERFMDEWGDPGRIALRSNHMLTRLAAIRGGLGIGMLSDFLAVTFDDLVPLAVPTPDLRESMWLVMHTDVRDNARVRAFADFAWGFLADQRDRFAPRG